MPIAKKKSNLEKKFLEKFDINSLCCSDVPKYSDILKNPNPHPIVRIMIIFKYVISLRFKIEYRYSLVF